MLMNLRMELFQALHGTHNLILSVDILATAVLDPAPLQPGPVLQPAPCVVHRHPPLASHPARHYHSLCQLDGTSPAGTFSVVHYIDDMQFTVQYPISYLSGKKMDDFDEFLESISDVLGLARPPIKTTPSGEAQLECSNLGCSSVCDTDQEPW